MKFRLFVTCLFAGFWVAQTLAAQATKGAPALRSVSQTFYLENTELFAEWRPLVVGQASRFTAHLTKIAGGRFQALADAKVNLTLTVQGTPLEVKTEAPERPGVFRLPITPTKAGTGRIVVEVTTQVPAERFVIEDVPVYANTEAALAKQAPAETGLARYPKEQSWEVDFATASVGKSVTVPHSAIVQQQGAPHVYVQRNPEAFELRAVKIGNNTGTSIEITSGLREGERIVVRGADKLRK
jgi:hypothetical protein